MSVFRRNKDGNYSYEFYHNGQRIYRTTKQRSKKVAQEIEAEHKARLARGEVGLVKIIPAPPLKDFEEKFKDHINLRSKQNPETIRFYESKLKRLLEYEPLASALLSAIDETLIEEYVQYRIKDVGSTTINRELATLRRLLHLAKSRKIISEVPRIKMLDGEHNREFVLSLEQERTYLEACPATLRDAAILMLDTGMRIGEVCKLTWLYVKERHLTVKGGGKSKRDRVLRLTPRVKEMLDRRRTESDSERVFSVLETSLNHLHSGVREDLGEDFWTTADPDFVLHSFRHTFLTRLAESGCDVFTLIRIAGWSEKTGMQMAMKYVHTSADLVEQAFERLEIFNAISTHDQRESIETQPVITSE